jgi:hypothetical protein
LRFCEPANTWNPSQSTSAAASSASSAGTRSASTPNCCGPPPIFIPEPLSSKSGFTRIATRGRVPSRSPMAMTRRASVSDSSSMSASAATAWLSSAGVLPGPAKLTWSAGIGVSSAMRSSPADAVSSASTRPARCCTTAGIGLALIA